MNHPTKHLTVTDTALYQLNHLIRQVRFQRALTESTTDRIEVDADALAATLDHIVTTLESIQAQLTAQDGSLQTSPPAASSCPAAPH